MANHPASSFPHTQFHFQVLHFQWIPSKSPSMWLSSRYFPSPVAPFDCWVKSSLPCFPLKPSAVFLAISGSHRNYPSYFFFLVTSPTIPLYEHTGPPKEADSRSPRHTCPCLLLSAVVITACLFQNAISQGPVPNITCSVWGRCTWPPVRVTASELSSHCLYLLTFHV